MRYRPVDSSSQEMAQFSCDTTSGSTTKAPLPAEFWKIFYKSVPELFNHDNDDIVQQLDIIIGKCRDHHEYYVPPIVGQRAEYEAKLPHYIAFTAWLLGQLARASTLDRLENYHSQFVDWQMNILDLLATKNQDMFVVIVEEYLAALRDLVAVRGQSETKFVFQWFCRLSQHSQQTYSQPGLVQFELEDCAKCSPVIARLLTIVRSQTYMLTECAPLAMQDYWSCLLSLLHDSDAQVVIAALDSVISNIQTSGFPRQVLVAQKLCVILDNIVSAVSSNYFDSYDSNEPIKNLLISFGSFFKILLENKGSGNVSSDTRLLKTLISLLSLKNPFLYSNYTSKEYCKLLAFLLRQFPSSVNIQLKLQSLLSSALNSPAILFVIESLLLGDLEKNDKYSSNGKTVLRDVKDINSVWQGVVELTKKSLEALNSADSPQVVQRSAKFVSATVRTAANVSLCLFSSKCSQTSYIFFGDKFYEAFNNLLMETVKRNEHLLNSTYHELIESSTHLVSLPELTTINVFEAHKLVVFLSVPWLKQLTRLQLPGVNLAAYLRMADLQMFSNDVSVKLRCVEGLMNTGGSEKVALDWRLAVLSLAQGHADTAVAVLQLLPVLMTSAAPETQAIIVKKLVYPYFTSALIELDSTVSTKLSELLPSAICSLAQTTNILRNKAEELNTQCKVCNGQSKCRVFINGQLGVCAATLMEMYLELRKNQSASVRRNVAASLKCWSNHINETTLNKHVVKWLVFIKDNDNHVRMALAQVSCHLFSASTEPSFVELYSEVAMAITHRSLMTSDKDLQLSVMATLYNIGSLPFDNVLWPSFKTFVFFLGHPSVMNPSVAQIYLKKVAAVQNKTVQEIFFRFQDEVFKVVAVQLVYNQLSDPNCVMTTLLNLTRGLGFQCTKELFEVGAAKHLLKYLLPLVVTHPNTTDLLSVVASAAGTQLATLLKNSFPYIYPHVFLFEDKFKLEKVCKVMEQFTELALQSLICFSFKVITCELLLHFHVDKAKVTEALSELRKFEFESSVEPRHFSSFTTDGEIARFIQPRFLAVLAYLDSLLVSRSGCESSKRLALLALPDLIKLMGPAHITPVRFKVLATLRSALNLYHSYFPELICFAWRAFVLNVTTLGPLLSTIFVSLLPLLENYPVQISSVFHILVVDNISAVSGHLAELYFVPDTPATHEIYTLVQEKLRELRKLPVKEQLAITLRMATHENSDVRVRGLHKLKSELALHRQDLVKLITAHDNVDPFIFKLLEALTSSCRDSSEAVRLASAECLGEIGAVDPGRLPNKMKMEVEEKEIFFVINSEAFVMRALTEFVRAFQAANHTTTMDSFAFGIQELLKIYNIPESGIWANLPDSTKEIITPFKDSRYRDLASDSDSQSHIPHPIFGTIHGSTLKSWAVNWVCRLIPTVTDEFVRKVFSVCQLGLKKDLETLLFFLPYIVLYAILGATKNQSKRIAEEMSAVLFWSFDQPSLGAATTPRSILTSSSGQDLPTNPDEAQTHTLCAKTVYQLFDFLYRWLRQTKGKCKPSEPVSPLSSQYQTLSEFLKTFSKHEIAKGSYRCKEYSRALLFLEEYMSENPNTVQMYLPFLGKIYYQLHDPDSFRGIIAIQEAEPTAQEMILYHEVTGKLQEAAACYERLGQENAASEDFYKAMVQCYLNMDQPATALKLAQGFLNSSSEQSLELLDEQAEAMLSLSMFPQLQNLLGASTHVSAGWGATLSQTLLHLSKREEDQMVTGLDNIRSSLVRSVSSCSDSHSGYRHSYDIIVKLHILTEVKKLGGMVLQMLECRAPDQVEKLFRQVVREDLDERLKLVQPSCRMLQPVLCVRRVVLSLAQRMFTDSCPNIVPLLTTEIANTWLKSIEIARKSGHYQQAYTNILTVEPYKPKGLFVEKAKLMWAKSEPEAALNTLHRGIEHHFPDAAEFRNLPTNIRMEDRRLCAEAKLLIATYNDENVNIDMETNLANYESAVAVCKNWEKSFVCLAQYKYKYLRTLSDGSEFLPKTLEHQVHMINFFGKSLQFGCEYIYQSMPRMLSVWLDFGTQLAQDSMSNRLTDSLAERRSAMDKMTALISTYSDRLPTYMFMTAFSQLISRICHPQNDCYKILKAIIVKIIIAYPQQALWMFLSVYKSPYNVRVKRCEEVLRSNEIQKEGRLCHIIKDFQHLFERLIELGAKQPPNQRSTVTVSIKTYLISLYRLVSNPSFSHIVIPLQKFRTISLPRSTNKFHNPFPEDMVYICGMKDDVVILASLQKPKKITFIGTDGKQYPLMCKPNDDLRLDSRMMEFNSIVNMYLQRDPDARDRALHIRTYSAVPLSDTSGLIEWVPNLVGLRLVISNIYKQLGIMMTPKEFKEMGCLRSDSLSKKRQVFLDKLLPRHPAVLREWYLREFSHPSTWYSARSSFVRTLAVMSIVGFMLGLGDRHGENILLDSTCGDVVHVDFNCLFNKGEKFDWPEKVPFRLTHNLVNAMGPTGVEGVFRHSCEITTRVMRQQMDQLMSVVRPFCYDPLVTWNTRKDARDENAEMTNVLALEGIQNIELRLQGIVRTRNRAQAIPLSVEGQVRTLISEATNVDNLCQMYVGWGPFL